MGMIIDQGVAILPITGTLVNRGAWLGTNSGVQSYEGIAQQLRSAAANGDVHAILLDLNSYGGEAGGVADLASEIREVAGTKRVVALLSDAAASAAYWLASAASEVVATETGLAGSIGVVLTHQDLTGAAEKAGVKITQIHAGAEKLLGSPFQPLSTADRAKLQVEVSQLYDLFIERVAAYRSIDAEQVRETEAAVYRGAKALRAGLVDRVMAGRDLLKEMQNRSTPRGASRTPKKGTQSMKTENTGGAPDAATYSEAEMQEARTAATADGMKAGATAERTRMKSILTSEHAAGREQMAQHLAFETDMAVDGAVALLEKSPQATAAPVRSPLDAAMEAVGTAGIKSVEVDAGSAESVRIDASNIYAQRRAAAQGK